MFTLRDVEYKRVNKIFISELKDIVKIKLEGK